MSPRLQWYLAHRRRFEVGFWVFLVALQIAFNATVAAVDLARLGHAVPFWEPLTWEASSNLVILALIPALLAFDRRFPLYLGQIRNNLPPHLLATVVFSLTHVLGMVALRHAVYASQGGEYSFGHWPTQLLYEYLKDIRSYFVILGGIYLYRHVLLRLQGEARLLDAPETEPVPRQSPRPERFLVRKFGKEFLVAVADVEWMEAAENYVNLHVRGHIYPLRSTMNALAARLDPSVFLRVHRRYIVNLNHTATIETLDAGDLRLTMKDGTRLPGSRRYRTALRMATA